MNPETMKETIRQTLDQELSRVRTSPCQRELLFAQAVGGKKMKKKLSTGFMLAVVLVLLTAAAVAAVLLSQREIVEQVAVPLAMENDTDAGIDGNYTPDQLAALIQSLNDNGFTLEENSRLMQALKNGQGYYEEETIMEICRQAFGGNFYTWTLEEQDWFNHLMVDIGWLESYTSTLPGKDSLTYEQAEALAFELLRTKYGQELPAEDRDIFSLSRQFFLDAENGNAPSWSFTLDPKDIDHGTYSVRFEDQDPRNTASLWADIPDWTQPYTGDDLLYAFFRVYGWNIIWPQPVMARLHDMMLSADINENSPYLSVCRALRLTSYPETEGCAVSRQQAIDLALMAQGDPRAALNSCVLTEYEGRWEWIAGLVIYPREPGKEDETAGTFAVSIDAETGNVLSVRKSGPDDDAAFCVVPQSACEKAHEGILSSEEAIHLAAEAIENEYPELDLLNPLEYRVQDMGVRNHQIRFGTLNILHGSAGATVEKDGSVSSFQADVSPLDGDNLMERYRSIHGFFGEWDQSVWVSLAHDMEALEPAEISGKLLKAGKYPEESSAAIGREEARKLAIQASGKRTAEVNTCILIHADPHPVWKIRLITDEPTSPVLELDAQTGKVLSTDRYKVDYTPLYVLYSLEKNWRKLELENAGPVRLAAEAVTMKYCDLWLDLPEPDFWGSEYEIHTDGLFVEFLARWTDLDSYRVELDENGFILSCEKTISPIARDREAFNASSLFLPPSDAPDIRKDGKPWVWKMDFAPESYWNQLEQTMAHLDVSALNLKEKELEWHDQYGDWPFWPLDMKICSYMLSLTPKEAESSSHFTYPLFPAPGMKTENEIRKIAEDDMHAHTDELMGRDFADSLSMSLFLWNDACLMDLDSYAGKPCWQVEFSVWEYAYNAWNTKYYQIISADGDILCSELTLDGNG